MNKNYLTRPFASELLGLEEVQKWAKDLGIMNHQLLKYSREKNKKPLSKFLSDALESQKKPEPVKKAEPIIAQHP